MFSQNLAGFVSALSELRNIPATAIQSVENNGVTEVTVNVPNFPVVSISKRGRFDMKDVHSFAEDGVATAFLACVYGDWHLANKRRVAYPYDRKGIAGDAHLAQTLRLADTPATTETPATPQVAENEAVAELQA